MLVTHDLNRVHAASPVLEPDRFFLLPGRPAGPDMFKMKFRLVRPVNILLQFPTSHARVLHGILSSQIKGFSDQRGRFKIELCIKKIFKS